MATYSWRDAVAEPVVVDEHHDDEHDRGDDGEDHLAGRVVEGVVATRPARRVDDEAADDRQRRLAEQQRPVDVAARRRRARADVAEAGVGLAANERAWARPGSVGRPAGDRRVRDRPCGRCCSPCTTRRTAAAAAAPPSRCRVERLGDGDGVEGGRRRRAPGTCTSRPAPRRASRIRTSRGRRPPSTAVPCPG